MCVWVWKHLLTVCPTVFVAAHTAILTNVINELLVSFSTFLTFCFFSVLVHHFFVSLRMEDDNNKLVDVELKGGLRYLLESTSRQINASTSPLLVIDTNGNAISVQKLHNGGALADLCVLQAMQKAILLGDAKLYKETIKIYKENVATLMRQNKSLTQQLEIAKFEMNNKGVYE
jgi:hypothetical protein